MVGEELLFHDVLHRFVLSDQVHLAVGINHHHIGSQRDELHPLRHVVGAYLMDYHPVASFQQWQAYTLADAVDIHAEWAIECHLFGMLCEFLCRRYPVIVPEGGEEDVYADIEYGGAPSVGEAFGCQHRAQERSCLVDQCTTCLEDQQRQLFGSESEMHDRVHDGFCIIVEGGYHVNSL